MNKYEQGKIYKLSSDESECFYIGSTIQTLEHRLNSHKCDIKKGKTGTHIDMGNHSNIRIELIEDYACKSNDELLAKEGFYIRQHRENLLNKNIPGRTRKEWDEDNKDKVLKMNKEWYEANSEKIKEQKKIYREGNKEVLSQKNKEYREANKEKRKEYYEANKEVINQKRKDYRQANLESIRQKDRERNKKRYISK